MLIESVVFAMDVWLVAIDDGVLLVDVELLEKGEAAVDELFAVEVFVKALHFDEERLQNYEHLRRYDVKVDFLS